MNRYKDSCGDRWLRARAKATAPRKVLLLGEHSVAHGKPAVVLAIDKHATVTTGLRTDRKIWVRSKTMNALGYLPGDQFHAEKGEKDGGEKLEDFANAMERTSREAFVTRKTMDGVRIEE